MSGADESSWFKLPVPGAASEILVNNSDRMPAASIRRLRGRTRVLLLTLGLFNGDLPITFVATVQRNTTQSER